MHIRVLRGFVWSGHSGEVGQLAVERTAVQALRITSDAGVEGRVDEDLDEPQPVLLVSSPRLAAVIRVGADDRDQANDPCIREETGDFADATTVLAPRIRREAEIGVEAVPKVVRVENV